MTYFSISRVVFFQQNLKPLTFHPFLQKIHYRIPRNDVSESIFLLLRPYLNYLLRFFAWARKKIISWYFIVYFFQNTENLTCTIYVCRKILHKLLTIWCNMVQYGATWYNTVQHGAIWCNFVHFRHFM